MADDAALAQDVRPVAVPSAGQAAMDNIEREFSFTDRDFHRLRRLVTQHAGIHLSEVKRNMIYGRLARRLRQLGLGSFGSYVQRLEQGDDEELREFINAVTTNLTSFFREPHHFKYLKNGLLPALLRRKAAQRRLRIWSAGCSTGEEPYSLAMMVHEVMGAAAGWDVRILATDIDTSVLARAQAGVYADERVADLDDSRRHLARSPAA